MTYHSMVVIINLLDVLLAEQHIMMASMVFNMTVWSDKRAEYVTEVNHAISGFTPTSL